MKKLVVLTGAGISAESGLKTFRGAGGLWEGHRVEDVATPEAWQKDPELVLRFYNERLAQLDEVEPNGAHHFLVEMEKYFDVEVITQNVDDLHERAGSQKVLHLHGQLRTCRCTGIEETRLQMPRGGLKMGDSCENGHQLRPHIVWFGEEVPMLQPAAYKFMEADVQLVVGTSLQVYPAASLIRYAPEGVPGFIVDPGDMSDYAGFRHIKDKASIGLKSLRAQLLQISGH